MRKYIYLLAAALVLAAAFAGVKAGIPGQDTSPTVTISPEELQQQIESGSLPVIYIENLY